MKKSCFQHLFVHVAKNANKCMSFWYIFGLVTATFWWLKGFLGKWLAECQNKRTHLRGSCVDCRAFQALRRRVQSKRSNFWPQWNERKTSLWKKQTRCSRFSQKAFGARTCLRDSKHNCLLEQTWFNLVPVADDRCRTIWPFRVTWLSLCGQACRAVSQKSCVWRSWSGMQRV